MNLTEDVKDVLKSSRVSGNTLELTAQLGREDYVRVNKAIEMLGGKWNRRLKKHVFPTSAEEVVAAAVASGKVVDQKKEFQLFETPVPLATQMVNFALDGVVDGERILEPSAGRGRIIRPIFNYLAHFQIEGAAVHWCEIQPELADRLGKDFPALQIGTDFLEVLPPTAKGRFYDRIIMNPPFSNGQDVAHIQHAFKFLRPGGTLVAISSPGWTFNSTKKFVAFKKWIQSMGEHATFQDVPEGTFAESGTAIRTVLIKIRKGGHA